MDEILTEALEALNRHMPDRKVYLTWYEAAALQQLLVDMYVAHAKTDKRVERIGFTYTLGGGPPMTVQERYGWGFLVMPGEEDE